MTAPTEMTLVGEYKGFRVRKSPDSDNYFNLFFVQRNGKEACCGQTYSDFNSHVESIIRQPLPTWMTGEKEARLSPYHDAEKVRRTCAHGVSYEQICDSCAESYGSARVR